MWATDDPKTCPNASITFVERMDEHLRSVVSLLLKHHGIGHFRARLLPDLKPSQNIPKLSLSKLYKFHDKKMVDFLLEVKICFIIFKYKDYKLPISIDLKMWNAHLTKNASSTKSEIKRNRSFFLVKFSHCIWRANSYILPNSKSGSSIKHFKCPQFTRVIILLIIKECNVRRFVSSRTSNF